MTPSVYPLRAFIEAIRHQLGDLPPVPHAIDEVMTWFRNHQERLSKRDGYDAISTLHISQTTLSTLPEEIAYFSGLSRLSIIGCNFTKVPSELKNLVHLEVLYFQGNNILEIPQGAFNTLTCLKELHLPNNDISVIESGAFEELTQLVQLALGNNAIEVLPEDIFQKNSELTTLMLQDNRIKTISKEIFKNNPKLKYVSLYQNNLPPACKKNSYYGLPDTVTMMF